MTRVVYTTVLLCLVVGALPAHAEVFPGCQSAMQQALSGYAGCRLLAQSKDSRRPDPAKLTNSLSKCATRFEAAAYKALGRYGTEACPPTSVAQFRAYMDTVADAASAATRGEALPDVEPCMPTPLPTATPAPTPTATPLPTPTATPRYVTNSNGTVTDNATQLQWERKSGDLLSPITCTDESVAGCNDPHNPNNFYTWSTGSPWTFDGTAASLFLAQLNTPPGFAGFMDWRLPTYWELKRLVSYVSGCGIHDYDGIGSPCIDPVFDPTRAGNGYWTSNTPLNHPDWASTIPFNDRPAFAAGDKQGFNPARAVRRASTYAGPAAAFLKGTGGSLLE